jgi:hypothetical protein
MRKLLGLAMIVTFVGVVTPTAIGGPTHGASSRIVVHGKFKSMSKDTRTITYTARNGSYSATWIGVRHYRLRGKINGRQLTGTIRTRQAQGGQRYTVSGSGKLGRRAVKIGGGGPDTLRTATLILS